MAVPKSKVSKARRDKRRNSHWKLAIPGVVACPKCGEPRLPHRACKACGTYNGREVVAVEALAEAGQSQLEWDGVGHQH